MRDNDKTILIVLKGSNSRKLFMKIFYEESINENIIILEKSKTKSQEFITQENASKILDVSVDTLYHMRKAGILLTKKIGKRVYYKSSTIMDRLSNTPLPY